jgi:hypothetical protein
MAQEGRTVLLEMLAEAHDARCRDNGTQGLLALDEWQWPEIEAADEQQIEGEIAQLFTPPLGQRILQRAELGHVVFAFHHELAVNDSLVDTKGAQRTDERLARPGRPVESAAGEELDFACPDVNLDPIAIKFQLMEPLRAAGRGILCCGERRLNEARIAVSDADFGRAVGDMYRAAFRCDLA